MIETIFRAVAAQSSGRFILKSLVSLIFVAIFTVIQKGGLALAMLVIFSGVTGPAIRIVTLRTSGILDRIITTPAHKPSMFLIFTGVWSAAVFAALVPALVILLFQAGPVIMVPVISGTVLAVSIGTLTGIAAKTLGDAHLYAILAAVPLIIGTLLPGPQSLALPYSSMSLTLFPAISLLTQTCFLGVWLMILAGLVSRM